MKRITKWKSARLQRVVLVGGLLTAAICGHGDVSNDQRIRTLVCTWTHFGMVQHLRIDFDGVPGIQLVDNGFQISTLASNDAEIRTGFLELQKVLTGLTSAPPASLLLYNNGAHGQSLPEDGAEWRGYLVIQKGKCIEGLAISIKDRLGGLVSYLLEQVKRKGIQSRVEVTGVVVEWLPSSNVRNWKCCKDSEMEMLLCSGSIYTGGLSRSSSLRITSNRKEKRLKLYDQEWVVYGILRE